MGEFEPARGDPPDIEKYQGEGTLEEAAHHLFAVVPEVNIVHLAISLLSLFVVVFGLFSGFIKERLYIGEAIIATGFGIAFSGSAAGIFAPRSWSEGHHFDEITLELTRAIIALSVFAVGVELPKAYVIRHWRSLSMLLGPIMLLGWMVTGTLMYSIIPGLDFLTALVIAAGATPTDPILASSVVGKGKFAQEHVPAHIRHILQAESGCNDGAAFPFLYLALFLLMREERSVGTAIGAWVYLVLLYQIVLGTTIGAVIGVIARKLLKFSKRRELIDRESMVAMYVALALLVTGLTTLAGSDDLLAAFACGTAFAWDDWFTESIEESNFSSIIDLLANCAIFLYLGATMPFSAWQNETTGLTVWRLVLLAVGVLALRRLPAMFALQWWIPDIKTRREALFAGHFGPMGVGAIFISTLAAAKLPTPTVPPVTNLDRLALVVQPVTYFLVLSSILVHGITIAFFTLGRRVHSRVTSMTRTFTAASKDSRGQLEEPSWMSRVKRAQNREDIVINRDDDAAEKGDLGRLGLVEGYDEKDDADEAAIGSGGGAASGSSEEPSGSETAVSDRHAASPSSRDGPDCGFAAGSEVSDDEAKLERPTSRNHEARLEEEIMREDDDDPSKNILADHDNETEGRHDAHVHYKKEKGTPGPELVKMHSKDSAHEMHYCKAGQTQTWQEGRKIIIDHNDGQDVEVIDLDASPEDARRAMADPSRRVFTIPDREIKREMSLSAQGNRTPREHEDNAVHKITQRLMKKGRKLGAAAAMLGHDESLTAEEKEARRKEKMKRDAWCRKEQKFRDSTPREWIEGNKVVTETFDGEVTVRELTDEEKAAKAARHLAALRALGHPVDSLAAEWARMAPKKPSAENVANAKGKSVDRSPTDGRTRTASQSPARTSRSSMSTTGVPLTRTDRIEPESDDDDNDDVHAAASAAIGSRSQSPGLSQPAQADRSYRRDAGDSSVSTARPGGPVRTNSAFQAVKQMMGLKVGDEGPSSSKKRKPATPVAEDAAAEDEAQQGASTARQEAHAPAPGQSIRFAADVEKPARSGSTGPGASGARQAPTVGSGLGMRRVPTTGSTRSAK